MTSSGCAEPAPDSWHRQGGWEPSPASSLLGPARLPPSPRAAATPQWAPRDKAGTATQTPALPCSPHCWITGQGKSRQRGEGTGQWHHWGQWGGHGAERAMLLGIVPACRNCLQAAASGRAIPRGCLWPWQCPSPGNADRSSHQGKPNYSSLPRTSASSCHGPGPQHGQAPVPHCPPWERCLLHRDMCQTRKGMGWDSHGQAGDGQPHTVWHRGHRPTGCSPPSCSPGCEEAQEEPSGAAGACCAPAVPCFPSYTAQLAGCLYRPELILAAPHFPLLPSPPAFPSSGARPPHTRHPSLTSSVGVARQVHGWHKLAPLPTGTPPSPQCVPQFPQLDDALPGLFYGVCSLPTTATLASPGTCG